ncbi:MAG TPA: ATP-binding domain-containing protein, partial [Beutenbergiaceae bacterium]|nr:ATP-binding domain-containing protein [Beutenbergiaceae bacterium]
IHALAEDIRMGEAEAVAHALNAAGTQDSVAPIGPDELLETLIPHARAMAQAARHGDSHTALGLLAAQQVLCAHREGPYGVRTWNQAIAARIHPGGEDWFAGQPVLVTRNDHALRLFNGDHGVVVNRDGRFVVAFDHGEGVREIPLSRLSDIVPAYAITIHRAQGSQFDTVYVVLPPQDSPLLTRELFYTAVTRASQRVRVIAAPGSVEAAITRHVNRASGLAQRLSHGEG